jgi:hypothetical protein
MLRFVIGPDGAVVPDLAAKLPGRGYWVSATREAVEKAVVRHIFVKAAQRRVKEAKAAAKAAGGPAAAAQEKLKVKADPGLADQVEKLLLKSAVGLLGLACRAGQLVTGFDKVKEILRRDSDVVLLNASDGAADGVEKLQRIGREAGEINIFSRIELSLATGRENVVHAALLPGGIRDRLLIETGRLTGLRRAVASAPQVKAKKV